MKKIFYIVMCIFILAATFFNVCFAYSNINCIGCATMLFITMETITTTIIAWGFRKIYKYYQEGKLDLFK